MQSSAYVCPLFENAIDSTGRLFVLFADTSLVLQAPNPV